MSLESVAQHQVLQRPSQYPRGAEPLLRGACVAACIGMVACSGGPGSPAADVADIALVNGKIITVDAMDTVAEAVAVKDGRIVAVGTSAEIEPLIGSSTQRIDLGGRAATPGLLDAHAHFGNGGATRLYVLDLSYPEVTSVADVVAKVAERVAPAAPGEWVRGRGWDEGKFEELRYVTAADLDAVSPDNPVWLTHTMGHYGAANSLALELADITADTPDPPGGTIDRDADGNATGVLKERAQGLVNGLIPPLSPEQVRDGMRDLAQAFNAEGMTGLKDPGIGQETWDAYTDVLADGDLSVRVFVLWRSRGDLSEAEALVERVAAFTRPYESTGDDRLISGGIKLMIDGSGGARTAWMHDDWNRDFDQVDTGNRGYPVEEAQLVRDKIRLFHDAGLHVSTHSIGDRGIDWVVDSYAMALTDNPRSGMRHGIIHANVPTDHAIDTMARLEREFDAAYPEPSPPFMWWIGDTYAGNFGATRALRLNPFATFVDKGITWASASDFSVTPFEARYGLWASVARETLLGVYGPNPWGMDESVDIRTALRSYTIWSARQMFLEDEIGSIEVGKYADLAVWDRDPYTVPTADIKDMVCELTLFDGRVVYVSPQTALDIP